MLRGEPFKRQAAIAKLHASETAMDNAREATQVHGGYGFMNEFPVARFYRDAKVLEIGEGTSEVQRMVIARSACGIVKRGQAAPVLPAVAPGRTASRTLRSAESIASSLVRLEQAAEPLVDQREVAGQHVGDALPAGVGERREQAAPVGRARLPDSSPERSSRSTRRVMPLVVSEVCAARSLIRSALPGERDSRSSTSNSARARLCSLNWAENFANSPV